LTLIETGAEQTAIPTGVKVYTDVPMKDVLIDDGFQIPTTPSLESVGNIGGVELTQRGPIALNVGDIPGLTFMTMLFEVAELLPQPPLDDTTQLTMSLSARVPFV